jgi:alpha-tubulin suppressor-like RCC1 family protein
LEVCASERKGTVTCWGARHPRTDVTRGPLDDGVRCATSVALGSSHLCAATSDGAVTCWGDNVFGQLGSQRIDATPMQVPGIDRAVGVLRGIVSACPLKDDGRLWCWRDGYLAVARRVAGGTLPHPIDW